MTVHAEPSCDLKPTPATDLGIRYVEELAGQLRCFDRVILHGTLIVVAHPGALLVSMQRAGFLPRDLTRFAQPITGQVREPLIGRARQHGVEIEMVVRKNFRQEDRVAEILKTRGTHPGLIHLGSRASFGPRISVFGFPQRPPCITIS